jgi:hypothetical protein
LQTFLSDEFSRFHRFCAFHVLFVFWSFVSDKIYSLFGFLFNMFLVLQVLLLVISLAVVPSQILLHVWLKARSRKVCVFGNLQIWDWDRIHLYVWAPGWLSGVCVWICQFEGSGGWFCSRSDLQIECIAARRKFLFGCCMGTGRQTISNPRFSCREWLLLATTIEWKDLSCTSLRHVFWLHSIPIGLSAVRYMTTDQVSKLFFGTCWMARPSS